MQKKYTKPLLLFFFILFSCCYEDELFENTREDYLGDNFRTDGFYYDYFQGKIQTILFFYRNGVYFLVAGDGKARTKPEEVKTLFAEDRIEWLKKSKYNWGIFNIKGNDIILETWHPTEHINYVHTKWGEILSDTTFNITKSHYRPENRISNTIYNYYFYPYSPKPDSTNTFIK